jgi:hypothetical protein
MSLIRRAPTSSLPARLSNVCLTGYELFRTVGGHADFEQYNNLLLMHYSKAEFSTFPSCILQQAGSFSKEVIVHRPKLFQFHL